MLRKILHGTKSNNDPEELIIRQKVIMLTKRNFTLIDTLDIDFHPGFSVITGETGAGKSIILGAISLLLGQRADNRYIKQGKDKCVVEAHFDLSKYGMESFFTRNDIELDAIDTIIRREITAAGKSRSFINDTPVSLTLLKELGEKLMDIHSQHQNLLLNKQDPTIPKKLCRLPACPTTSATIATGNSRQPKECRLSPIPV